MQSHDLGNGGGWVGLGVLGRRMLILCRAARHFEQKKYAACSCLGRDRRWTERWPLQFNGIMSQQRCKFSQDMVMSEVTKL